MGHISPENLASEEDFWYWVQNSFSASPNIINMNNGGVCPQPKVVQEIFEHYNRVSNEGPAYFMWRIVDAGRENVRRDLAKLADCSPETIAIQRNTSEALETVIFGLNLEKGDEIVLTKQDYPNMINAWKQREIPPLHQFLNHAVDHPGSAHQLCCARPYSNSHPAMPTDLA